MTLPAEKRKQILAVMDLPDVDLVDIMDALMDAYGLADIQNCTEEAFRRRMEDMRSVAP